MTNDRIPFHDPVEDPMTEEEIDAYWEWKDRVELGIDDYQGPPLKIVDKAPMFVDEVNIPRDEKADNAIAQMARAFAGMHGAGKTSAVLGHMLHQDIETRGFEPRQTSLEVMERSLHRNRKERRAADSKSRRRKMSQSKAALRRRR